MPRLREILRPQRTKEEKELFLAEQYFTQFPSKYGIPLLQNMDPPAPDILCSWDDSQHVAIEITELILQTDRRGSPERKRNAEFRILQEALAREMSVDAQFSLYGGSIFVRQDVRITDENAVAIAAVIREFVLRNCSAFQDYEHETWHPLKRDQPVEGWLANEPALKSYVTAVRVCKYPHPNINSPIRWHRWEATTYLEEIPSDLLVKAINRKATCEYDRRHGDIWLLLAATGQTKDEHFAALKDTNDSLHHDDVITAARASSFSRVIVWNYVTRESFDLCSGQGQISECHR